VIKLVCTLPAGEGDRATRPRWDDLRLPGAHLACPAEPTDAIFAALARREARPQNYVGVVCAWLRDESDVSPATRGLAELGGTRVYRVDEVVHWDESEIAPGAAPVVLLYFVQRRRDLSPEAFATHYRTRHAPLAREHHPGVARYVQNFVVSGPADAESEIDAISELWFRSERDAVERFYRDARSQDVIAEDVRRFVGGGFSIAARPPGRVHLDPDA